MRALPVFALAAAACAAPARDVLLYSQPTVIDDAKVGLGWFSHSEPRARRNFKHADDLVLDQDATVTRVAWWGQSEGVQFPDLTNFDSFTVEFFSGIEDGTGAWIPGSLLATETFLLADTSPTPTGRSTPNGALEHRHEALLSIPFSIDAGQRYFIAVSAGLVANGSASDAWMWQDAEFHDGWSGVWSWSAREWTSFYDTDSALELYGVPAPGAPLILAAAAIAGSCRRSRSR
ncbi:MAG TPA: hypothetical protein VFF69_13870 [Phycisphaerales bacterium]|nr:hypothetical protein [Phycisphaerales bacterium]